jgi:hypothetical protein
MLKGVVLAASISALLSVPLWADSKSETTLDGLSRDFVQARSMPAGSRPMPPEGDLDYLTGVRLSVIRRVLGPPDKRESGWDPPPGCKATLCYVWTYGPAGVPTTVTPSDRSDGTMEVTVTTGGPYLLVLGFKDRSVVSASWLGQK